MTLPTQASVPLDQVFTRYAYKKVGGSEYKDNRYKNRALLKLIRERKLTGDGGANIVHPINLGTTFNGKSLARNETFSIVGDSAETWSKYQWSVIIETCFVSWWDVRETNNNPMKMKAIMDSRLDETRENIEENIEAQLCQTTAAAATDLNPILSIVATTGATGGLNPSTAGQSAWAAQTEAGGINWSVEGVGRTRQLVQAITDNKGNPDVILLPDDFWSETCEIGDAATVINMDAKTRGGTKYADLGATVPFILNIPVIHSPAWNTVNTTTGVVLDLDGIHLVVDPKFDMYIWPFKEMTHHGRLGWATVQVEVAQLTASARRAQGLLPTLS